MPAVHNNSSHGHSRASSTASTAYSLDSSPSHSIATTSTRRTTPSRSPVVRTHGPLLLPKIRSQDQNIVPNMVPIAQCQSSSRPSKRARTSPAPSSMRSATSSYRGHSRSMTNPENIYNPNPVPVAYSPPMSQEGSPTTLIGSPVLFPANSFAVQHPSAPVVDTTRSQRASSCNLDDVTVEKFGFPTYRQMPSYVVGPNPAAAQAGSCGVVRQESPAAPAMMRRDVSPVAAPEPVQQLQPTVSNAASNTTILNYLTAANPAPSLVHTISFPLRDPHTKHFWWDVRQIRPWTSFNTSTVLSLSNGAAASLLTCPLPSTYLPSPAAPTQRHPETESALAAIYASWYLPRLNAALALSSNRPLQLAVAPRTGPHATRDSEQTIVATVPGDASSAAAIFGGKPSARVVGLVKSFDRFNTGMRVEGNVKRVEYLRGLAHLHHVMREHGCRYGFILTEIELVVVRNGLEGTPHFGFVEVTSCQLAATGNATTAAVSADGELDAESVPMTACLALWGLCMLASDEPLPQGHAAWRAEIGAPAEGTRRKALPRDSWMPQPQLAEKREAKRSRGWVWPEDPVGRKELGKRGVRYGAC
ncbi:hypothetical protein M406DRAFT_273578 [Cryphonectria parasitica EP155]|uniref:Sialidase n=1 Tax=Cryphonectria parasitica (strain ATCC 38755 / EP155) TaxID=660469 RepID=A0A9P4Y910_CRYP1|nr:uncharacterized protein M406DRAFT_273578 [Cryphonectria parasitica EP155]KAF3769018.1 hypothetical protein M406DRAFT_273578 [Cryphonectria parasitica EP155]